MYQALLAAVGGIAGLLALISWLNSRRRRTDVRGKVVLITGANSGLGRECARTFFKAGCNVILAGRNLKQLTEVQNDLLQNSKLGNKASVLQLDLGDLACMESKMSEAVSMFGHVDILINNAGISYRGLIQDTDMSVHQKLMTVNYFGQVALTQALLPHMVQLKQGHIVAISSLQGRVAIPNRSAYAASKHALQAFFDSLRAELSGTGVHVCVVSPGYIKTNLSHNAVCADGSSYGVMDKNTESGMEPSDVADQILKAVERRAPEIIPANIVLQASILLRAVAPSIFFWLMRKRALKERKLQLKKE